MVWYVIFVMWVVQIQSVLSSGTGEFDEERLLHQLPKELNLPEKKVHRAVEDQAKDRKRTTLVQAVSYLRQKKMDDTVKALNNLVACNKVGGTWQGPAWSCDHTLLCRCWMCRCSILLSATAFGLSAAEYTAFSCQLPEDAAARLQVGSMLQAACVPTA